MQFYVFLRAKTVEIHKTVQRYNKPVHPWSHWLPYTAWEDQRCQVCQCMLYGTGYPQGLPVPCENSGTLTPLTYHARSGTGKPCSLLVASGSFFLRKSNSWKRTKYRIRRHKIECSLRINTCNKSFPRICFTKSTV